MWKQGIRLKDCMNITLIGRDIIDFARRLVKMSPVVASSKPAMIFRMVDFPEPEAPSSV